MKRWLTAGGRSARVLGAAALVVTLAAGADGAKPPIDFDAVAKQARVLADKGVAAYRKARPADRMTWGGLAAAAGLGLGVLFERTLRLRRRRVLPSGFEARFLERLKDGRLDRGKALDFCEVNASPASRVALAAVRRWGRPTADLERAAALALRVEADRLRRNVGTLRRVAALSPLIGLLGTLVSASRALAAAGPGTAWGPAMAEALGPLTAGVALATLALVAYDGLAGKVEALVGGLERVGAETVDAVAMSAPNETRSVVPSPSGPARTPHQIRIELPGASSRPSNVDDDDDY